MHLNTEINRAKNIYKWLWFSPILTIPTLIYVALTADLGYELICGTSYPDCNYALASYISLVSAVLISALWHLFLLIPGSNKESEFIRWHGRQALLLAGIRTLVPLLFMTYGFAFGGGYAEDSVLSAIPVLILIWLTGTIWGQSQAAGGDCSLMRWAGHGKGLPLKTAKISATASKNISDDGDREDEDELVDIIRFNRDPEQRQAALEELERLGLVEPLSGIALKSK